MSSAMSSFTVSSVFMVLLFCSPFGKGFELAAGHILPPPCPRNYMFSCQPALQPVPCEGVAAPARHQYAAAPLPLTATIPIYASAAPAAAPEPLSLPPPFSAATLHPLPTLSAVPALSALSGLTTALAPVSGCGNSAGAYTHNVPVYVQPASVLPAAESSPAATASVNQGANNLSYSQASTSSN